MTEKHDVRGDALIGVDAFVCELFGEDLTEDERRRRQRQINHMLAKGRIPARKAGRLWIGSRRRVRDHFAAGNMPIDETARGGYGVTDEKGTGGRDDAEPCRQVDSSAPFKRTAARSAPRSTSPRSRRAGDDPRGGSTAAGPPT